MDTSNPHQLFATLGLLPTATAKEVKIAYHKLALIHHPDKGVDRDLDKMKAINVAYTEIMNENLYRPPRTRSSRDENEPWYEFTQLWRPTSEEFRHFNEECISAYVERYDDEIRIHVSGFDELEEHQREKLRHKYRVWLNGSKKQLFEPYPPKQSPPGNTPEASTTVTPERVHAMSTGRERERARKSNLKDDPLSAHADALLIVLVLILTTWAIFLNIVTPGSLGVWFLCYMVITMCAPMGWADQIVR